ncbi:outer membrane autotransporter barrel protein (plasmid) [Paraburkholderia phymatum STM815]|uniref:Outer membrane autotransporter barrel protein n=1 Tax=Paraburkholderia phymatum (strain DSM 17167 / CIP 108236 / LMG 21445 / STM815) TaxID=391038 RepID=B2JVZ3_PARP8|nr:outer membrane autotransporter barrel protein [Paraburkholderia phymatum STM815]
MIWPRRSFVAKSNRLWQADLGGGSLGVIAVGTGLRGQWTIETGGCRDWQPYGRVNQSRHDWSGGVDMQFGQRPVSSARRRDLDMSCRRRHGAALAAFQHLRTGWLPAELGTTDGGNSRGVRGDHGFVKRSGQTLSSSCT